MSAASLITSGEADCRSSLSERASFTDFTDLSSVAPKADESAATAVSPAVVAAPHSVIAKDGRDAPARMGVSSRDLPAASSVVAGLSFGALVDALEAAGGFKKNASTFLVAADNAIHSPVSTTSIPTT